MKIKELMLMVMLLSLPFILMHSIVINSPDAKHGIKCAVSKVACDTRGYFNFKK